MDIIQIVSSPPGRMRMAAWDEFTKSTENKYVLALISCRGKFRNWLCCLCLSVAFCSGMC